MKLKERRLGDLPLHTMFTDRDGDRFMIVSEFPDGALAIFWQEWGIDYRSPTDTITIEVES